MLNFIKSLTRDRNEEAILHDLVTFDSVVFFTALLPPIIFAAGMSQSHHDFHFIGTSDYLHNIKLCFRLPDQERFFLFQSAQVHKILSPVPLSL